MEENLDCKQSFRHLDSYNHKFVNVKEDEDSIFHYFSLILQQEGKDDQVPDKSTEIVKYI